MIFSKIIINDVIYYYIYKYINTEYNLINFPSNKKQLFYIIVLSFFELNNLIRFFSFYLEINHLLK